MTYFSPKEQACPCCNIAYLATGFLDSLNELRDACGHSMPITSMSRCKAHNKAVGGKPNSLHLVTHPWGCCAADVSTIGWDGSKKWRFVGLAVLQEFSIGIAGSFIHVDRRTDYPAAGYQRPVLFNY